MSKYVVFEIPDHLLGRVVLTPTDTRDGDGMFLPLTGGTPWQAVVGMLPLLSPEEVGRLKMPETTLPFQRAAREQIVVTAGEHARTGVVFPAPPPADPSFVVAADGE